MSEFNAAYLDQIVTMLPVFKAVEQKMDKEIGRMFNAFDLFNTDENASSQVLAFLLNPAGAHGQGDVFLRLFIERFVQEFRDLPLSDVSVSTEYPTCDGRRIDVLVNIDGHLIGIENKFRGAQDQNEQVADYLKALEVKAKKYALIYLGPRGELPNENSFPLPVNEREKYFSEKKFILASWVPVRAKDKDSFDPVNDALSWLGDCAKECQAENVRWFIKQFSSFVLQEILSSGEVSMVSEFMISYAMKNSNNLEATLRIGGLYDVIKDQLMRQLFETVRQEMPVEGWKPIQALNDFPLQKQDWPLYVGIGMDNNGIGIKSPTFGLWDVLPKDDVHNYFSEKQVEDIRNQKLLSPNAKWIIKRNRGWPLWLEYPSDEIQKYLDIFNAVQEPKGNSLVNVLIEMVRFVDGANASR